MPDGLVRPLCCDQCATSEIKRIVDCSWRRKDNDYHGPCDQCVRGKMACTHGGIPCTSLWDQRRAHMNLTMNLPFPGSRAFGGTELTAHPQWNWGAGSSDRRSASPEADPVRFGRGRDDGRDRDEARRGRSPTPPGSRRAPFPPGPPNPGLPAPHQAIASALPVPPFVPVGIPGDPGPLGPRPGPVTHLDPRRWYGVTGSLDPNSNLAQWTKVRTGASCMMCNNKLAGNKKCDVNLGDENGVGKRGCTLCSYWGVVCSVQVGTAKDDPTHQPLPSADASNKPKRTLYNPCGACLRNSTRCDRKWPCDSCVLAGLECVTANSTGKFRRGVSGDTMPDYYRACGYGPLGVNDSNFGVRFDHYTAPDADLLYLQAVLAQRPELLIDLGRRPDNFRQLPIAAGPGAPAAPGPAAPGPSAPGPSTAGPSTAPVVPGAPDPPPLLSNEPESMDYAPVSPDAPPVPNPVPSPAANAATDEDYHRLLTGQIETQRTAATAAGNLAAIEALRGYVEASTVARTLSQENIGFPRAEAILRLYEDVQNLRPLHDSVGVAVIRKFMEETRAKEDQANANAAVAANGNGSPSRNQVAIRTPPGIDTNVLEALNPTGRPLNNVVLHQPPDRPYSPGPPTSVFDMARSWEISHQHVPRQMDQFAQGHPEYIDRQALFVLQEYPYRRGHHQLGDVPFVRSDAAGVIDLTNGMGIQMTCAEIRDGNECGNYTDLSCESKSHTIWEPICNDCNNESKQRLYRLWADTPAIQTLRAYLCYDCLKMENSTRFQNTGFRVWGFAPNANFSASLTRAERDPADPQGPLRNVTYGGFQGIANPVTGCSCAEKLFNRVLCTPHRTQHVIDMESAAQAMRKFVRSMHGKMVCPLCRVNAGVDEHGFAGLDLTTQDLAWACLACHEWVFATPGDTGLHMNIALPGVEKWGVTPNGPPRSPSPPPPAWWIQHLEMTGAMEEQAAAERAAAEREEEIRAEEERAAEDRLRNAFADFDWSAP